MKSITFSDNHYTAAANAPLKGRLQVFFNREEVQQKLDAVARSIFPEGDTKSRPGYGFTALWLQQFGMSDHASDGDPYNLVAAVLQTAANAKTDTGMPPSTRLGLEGVADEVMALVNADRVHGDLKTSILLAAKAAGFTGQQRG